MYQPEEYWTEVAERIAERGDGDNVIAGDDEPYYRYKRERFIDLLTTVNYSERSVLEVGCGPGGNLMEILKASPKRLVGVDISQRMVDLASSNLPGKVEIKKVNGTALPFADDEFDIVITATVLQHNTDVDMLKELVAEISRVSKEHVILFERVESSIKGDELCLGRPVKYYESLMERHGFGLHEVGNIRVGTSYYVSGAIRKVFNPSTRLEGEPISGISRLLQTVTLPITKQLDRVINSTRDVTKISFRKKDLG